MANDYKDTLFLPKTDFPMRANLSQREPEFLKFWYDIDVYGELKKKNKDKPSFILHDGPPPTRTRASISEPRRTRFSRTS